MNEKDITKQILEGTTTEQDEPEADESNLLFKLVHSLRRGKIPHGLRLELDKDLKGVTISDDFVSGHLTLDLITTKKTR